MTFYFDTETFPIGKAGKATTNTVPKLVCMGYQYVQKSPFDPLTNGPIKLVDDKEAVEVWDKILNEGPPNQSDIVGLNTTFDIAVMTQAYYQATGDELTAEKTFALFDAGRVKDVGISEMLYDIERGGMFRNGGYSLADLYKRKCGGELGDKKGPDVWRVRYNELYGKPIEAWPTAARDYAIRDVEATREIYLAQEYVSHTDFQVAADWAFTLMSAHGLIVDYKWTQHLWDYYAYVEATSREVLESEGIIDKGVLKRAKKTELFADAWNLVGESPILTPKGAVSTDKTSLRKLKNAARLSGKFPLDPAGEPEMGPAFNALVQYNRAQKFKSTYLQPLLDAAEVGAPLCPRINPLVDSGRTSSSGPNIQNFVSRTTEAERHLLSTFSDYTPEQRVEEGIVVGTDIRGCIVPREGHVFVSADYTAIEMAALAQVCANMNDGELTPLGLAINNGDDLHLRVAQYLLDAPYEEIYAHYKAGDEDPALRDAWWEQIKVERDVGKIYNYGMAGGGSPASLVEFAAGFGTQISLEKSRIASDAWRTAWSFMPTYFRNVDRMESFRLRGFMVEQHGPGRTTSGWRRRLCRGKNGKAGRNSAYNTLFQGKVGDGFKYAAYRLAKKCYVETESPLFGARTVLPIHDEFGVEVLAECAEAAGPELSNTMVEAMAVFIPDIKIEANFSIQKRWGK